MTSYHRPWPALTGIGTLVTKEDLESVQVPVSLVCVGMSGYTYFFCRNYPSSRFSCSTWEDPQLMVLSNNVCLENDQLFPDDVRLAGQKHLEESGIEHEIKVYSDVPHGELGSEQYCLHETHYSLEALVGI